MVKRAIISIFILIGVLSCFKEPPGLVDGQMNLEITVRYRDMLTFKDYRVSRASVSLKTYDYNSVAIDKVSDTSGVVVFRNLPLGHYHVAASGAVWVPAQDQPDSLIRLTVFGSSMIIPDNEEEMLKIADTIYTFIVGSGDGLKINELYTVGPPNERFYFYDQYIELYNASPDTVYLDGMLVCRMGSNNSEALENISYIFQFPGVPVTGRQYPVAPAEFVVLAQDAIDHRGLVFGDSLSVDLSNADWEFHNELDYADYVSDVVPDIVNIIVGKTVDFLLNLTDDVVIIADGSDVNYLDGLDIETVIDCVEYSNDADHQKHIPAGLDRGYAGVGQNKYSASSIERIKPGYDTNNSTVDFVNISSPTPGYQHNTE